MSIRDDVVTIEAKTLCNSTIPLPDAALTFNSPKGGLHIVSAELKTGDGRRFPEAHLFMDGMRKCSFIGHDCVKAVEIPAGTHFFELRIGILTYDQAVEVDRRQYFLDKFKVSTFDHKLSASANMRPGIKVLADKRVYGSVTRR